MAQQESNKLNETNKNSGKSILVGQLDYLADMVIDTKKSINKIQEINNYFTSKYNAGEIEKQMQKGKYNSKNNNIGRTTN